jgi:glycine/D-amino acid oxidase-like deaminating enzyme
MRSFWEQNSLLDYDVAIVGAGIVGLSVASSILERKPKTRVLVLERGLLPTGASTRNAGFSHFGSLTEVLADVQKMGEDKCLQLVEKRWKGLLKMGIRLGKKNIDFQQNGGYELLLDKEASAYREEILRYNDFLRPIFPTAVYSDSSHKIAQFGFQNVKGLLYNRYEGQINTGKMMDALWLYAQKRGARILTGTDITHFEEDAQGVALFAQDDFVFRASKVIFCTNAFTKRFFPDIELQAGRGQVLITKPLPALPFKGAFHFDEGFYYFRNFENRVLFGGGRNNGGEAENTTEFGLTDRVQQDLEQKLRDIILPRLPFEIAMRWSGIMAFSADKKPIKTQTSAHTWLVARLNGMGVALASQLGEEVAEELL